jgi:hypothetical protein
MGKARELAPETERSLAELWLLSNRAARGEPEDKQALRKALKEASGEVVEQVADHARRGQRFLANTLAAGEPLEQEAILERLDRLRAEISGPAPSALESLLVERIASTLLLVELLEALTAAQLQTGDKIKRSSPRFLRFYLSWLESAHRRHLAAIKALVQVRKMLKPTVAQINIASQQVNMTGNLTSETSEQVRSR